MLDREHREFATTLGALMETFGKELTEAKLLGYWVALRELDLATFQQAVYRAMAECEYLPTPARLRELAGVYSSEARAIAAWGDVLKGVAAGPYKSVNFEDVFINATIRLSGGWPTFVGKFTGHREEEFARNRFIKDYKHLHASGVDGELTLPLPGINEASVVNGELRAAVPKLIRCDEQRAAAKTKPRLERPAELLGV